MADALHQASKGGDLLLRIAQQIEARRDELRPMLAEYERLLSASQALEQEPRGPAARSPVAPRTSRRSAEQSAPARPAARATRKAVARRGSAAGAIARAGSDAARRTKGAGRPRAVRGAAQQAILAALEHGSHTAGELATVTAMSGPNIRENLRRLLGSGAVTRAKRDGKAAYALARSVR